MLQIAVLEPDRKTAEQLMGWLEQAGHQHACCSYAEEFLACLKQQSFDLVLIDCQGADRECFELIEQGLTSQSERIPLLYVAQADDEQAIVQALEYGVDDYVIKPLAADELLNRIGVLVRRFTSARREQLPDQQQFGIFWIDREQRQLLRDGQPISLTGKDFSLADYLFTHQNQLLSRNRLLAEVWGVSQQVNTRTVDMHISRLRKSLGLEGSGYEIQTVHQHGYRLQQL